MSEPSPPDAWAIETRQLVKTYGKLRALDGLDLTVRKGELYGFIGPNGAGKTTTIQVLATLLPPTTGHAFVCGLDVRKAGRDVRRRIGYMPDFLGLYESLRVDEYLEFFAAAYEVPRARRAKTIGDVLEVVSLTDKRDAQVGELSRGMQQRLSLARVLVHDPEVLLLDEPASGLDPRARVEHREILKELSAMGKTILLSSHILSELAEVCTSLGVLAHGRILLQGPVQEVLQRAGGENAARVVVEGRTDEARVCLLDLPNVTAVDETGPGELRVHLVLGADGLPTIAERLVTRGFRLRHLSADVLGLEEAYLRLTSRS